MRPSWRPESDFDTQSQALAGNRAQQQPLLDGGAPGISSTGSSTGIGPPEPTDQRTHAPGGGNNSSNNSKNNSTSSKRGRGSGVRMQLPPIHRMVTDIVTPKEALESLRGPYKLKAIGGGRNMPTAPLTSSQPSGRAAPASIPTMHYSPAQNTGMATSFSAANTAAANVAAGVDAAAAAAARRNETESDLSRGMRRKRKRRRRRNRELAGRGPSGNNSSSSSISSAYSSSNGDHSAGAGANRSSADRPNDGGFLRPSTSSRARRRHRSHTDQSATIADNAGELHTGERRMSLSHHSRTGVTDDDAGNRMQGLECSGSSGSLGSSTSPASSGSPADSLSSFDDTSLLSESTRATSQSGSSSQSGRNSLHQQLGSGYPTSGSNSSSDDSQNMGNQSGHLPLDTLEPSCAEARAPQMPQLHMAGFLVDSVTGTTSTISNTAQQRDVQRDQNSHSQSQPCSQQQQPQLQQGQQLNDEQSLQRDKQPSRYISSFGLQASPYCQQNSELVYPSYSGWLKLQQERAEQEAHIQRSSATSSTASGVPGGQFFREDAPLEVPVKRRINLPKNVTNTLRSWLSEHVDNPYPTEEDKQRLMRETGLTVVQLSNWFINARRRVLPPSHRRSKSRQHRA